MYIDILRRLRNADRRECITNSFLLHDSAPAHRQAFVKDVLAKKNMTTLPHPPYSPDLVVEDF